MSYLTLTIICIDLACGLGFEALSVISRVCVSLRFIPVIYSRYCFGTTSEYVFQRFPWVLPCTLFLISHKHGVYLYGKAEKSRCSYNRKYKIEMFKITKFNVCVLGMLVGIGFISALPFIGLSCRWCSAGG